MNIYLIYLWIFISVVGVVYFGLKILDEIFMDRCPKCHYPMDYTGYDGYYICNKCDIERKV